MIRHQLDMCVRRMNFDGNQNVEMAESSVLSGGRYLDSPILWFLRVSDEWMYSYRLVTIDSLKYLFQYKGVSIHTIGEDCMF